MNEIRTSDSVVLRRPSPQDIARLVYLLNDPVYHRMLCGIAYPYSTEDAKQWVYSNMFKKDQDPTKIWSIHWRRDKNCAYELCGMVGAYQWRKEQSLVEVGYWVGKDFWGQGIATNALGQLLKHVVQNFQIKKVIAHTSVRNASSERVLEKHGFLKSALIEKHLEKDGVAISASHWQKSYI